MSLLAVDGSKNDKIGLLQRSNWKKQWRLTFQARLFAAVHACLKRVLRRINEGARNYELDNDVIVGQLGNHSSLTSPLGAISGLAPSRGDGGTELGSR